MGDARPLRLCGIRGATTVEHNTREAIVAAARELLETLIARNGIVSAHVASALFTTTTDLDAEFPAVAAREIGCLERCLRVLVHLNTDREQSEMQHVYLRGATALRPDVSGDNDAQE